METPESLFRASQPWISKSEAARFEDRHDDYIAALREAFRLQREAALLLRDRQDAEPTRAVLFRSAGSLAMRLGEWRMAEQLAAEGLAGDPHPTFAEDLRQLIQTVDHRRRLAQRKLSADTASLVVSFDKGDQVKGPRIKPSLKSKRSVALEAMIRDMIWNQNRPAGEVPPKHLPPELKTAYELNEMDRSNGLCAIEMELACRTPQLPFPELQQSPAQNIIDAVYQALAWVQGDGTEHAAVFGGHPDRALQFAARAREFLPDGRHVSQMTVWTNTDERLIVNRWASEIDLAALHHRLKSRPDDKPPQMQNIRGTLTRGDALKQEIVILEGDQSKGKTKKTIIKVGDGLAAIVREYFGQEVEAKYEVRANNPSGNLLLDIYPLDRGED
jgi:hypothetical protein